MIYLILSIICSVTVCIIFKITKKYDTNAFQIIGINYMTAIVLCYGIANPDTNEITAESPWILFGLLGILLPVIFNFLILSVKYTGIARTDAAQRLSLFIPLMASWLLFGESFNVYKIIGFICAFLALLLILKRPSGHEVTNWIYPSLVLLGFGTIDILFKKIALYSNLPFTTSLLVVFSIAMVVSGGIVAYKLVVKKEGFKVRNILFGVLVGIFNFGNILCYLEAHKVFTDSPSTVFAGMNMGVVIAGTLVGVLFFREKLSKANFLGLLLALIAIGIIISVQF
jgi:drug/metabolite transporter (DMT)-like permease